MSAADEALDPEETGCQLVLIGPPSPAPERFAADLDAALAGGGIAGFVLRPGQTPALAPALREVCRTRSVAFLIEDDLELALEVGADGLHLTATATLRAARAALGEERIIGAACGTSRHDAMVAGEHGADYVAFGAVDGEVGEELIDLLGWWSEVFVLPCLALGAIGPEQAATLARAGADFLGVSDAAWQHPGGPAAGVRALREAIVGP